MYFSQDTILQALWQSLAQEFFPEQTHLHSYQIRWSKRKQKRTLASCVTERCRVTVARELNYSEHRVWLKPLLYHEMCHAVLGREVSRTKRGFAWHGPEFKALERRHPLIPLFDAWVQAGGWARAVRSDRARQCKSRRKRVESPLTLT